MVPSSVGLRSEKTKEAKSWNEARWLNEDSQWVDVHVKDYYFCLIFRFNLMSAKKYSVCLLINFTFIIFSLSKKSIKSAKSFPKSKKTTWAQIVCFVEKISLVDVCLFGNFGKPFIKIYWNQQKNDERPLFSKRKEDGKNSTGQNKWLFMNYDLMDDWLKFTDGPPYINPYINSPRQYYRKLMQCNMSKIFYIKFSSSYLSGWEFLSCITVIFFFP